jgi:hypothetical protein
MTRNKILQIIFALITTGIILTGIVVVVRSAPPVAPGYPPVKQTYEASVEQTRITASNRPQPPPGASPIPRTPTPATIGRQPAGAGFIVDDFVPPFAAMSHVITSMWYQESATQRTVVYAGALRDNPGVSPQATQSVVIVEVQTLDGKNLPGGGTYLAPQKVGALKIVNAQGARLILQAETGATFYFDVAARQFVASP